MDQVTVEEEEKGGDGITKQVSTYLKRGEEPFERSRNRYGGEQERCGRRTQRDRGEHGQRRTLTEERRGVPVHVHSSGKAWREERVR